ncbi:MAG: tRNA pseudouridine(38-40) synthase TruA [Dictyoglomaceae bacterium]|nr:tRNA pseudouridine(38-40) synthase TruA [Dictyoglomaceae bacterium]
MVNWKIEIAYIGKEFFGFQKQPQKRTVQRVLESLLSTLFNEEVKVIGAGRTDAGVHALGQVVNFKTNKEWEEVKLKEVLKKLLPDDILLKKVERVDDNFHARFSAKRRWYMYIIYNNKEKNLFLKDFSWWIEKPLDKEFLIQSAELLKGEHNFVNFAILEKNEDTNIYIENSFWVFNEDFLFFFICAPYFLRKMVRFLVAGMVEVSLRNRNLEDWKEYLNGEKGKRFSIPSPPQGLYLYKIDY